MRAYQLVKAQTPPEFRDVPEPTPGPGQVVVKVAACGLCHTDFSVIAKDDWGDTPPPFTLGHEIAGRIQEIGSGVTGFKPGDGVVVMPGWSSCGRCHACRSGEENRCLHLGGIKSAGVGYDGGLASYVLVPSARFLVPLPDGLDLVEAAPLTDAGLTTYSAIKPVLPRLYPGSTAVVIGIGGLGLMAVQFLLALTGARVIALDAHQSRLDLAKEHGADATILSDANAAAQILDMTKGTGAQFVLDCVGVDATIASGIAMLSRGARLTLVGAGGGKMDFGFFTVPPGTELSTSFNGGSLALSEVLNLASLGRIKSIVDRYALSDIKRGYDDLQRGRLNGRAVAIPDC